MPRTPKKSARSAPDMIQETQQVFSKLGKMLGYPVISYWTSTGGSICQNDVVAMSQLLQGMKAGSTLGLFIKSDGGNPEAALRLIHLLRDRSHKLVLFAPFECASAATMIALGADQIHMGSTSYLTAVDSSLKHDLSPLDSRNQLVSVSQDEVMRIRRLWKESGGNTNPYPEVYKYLHPLVIGALDRSSSLSIRICQELISYHMKDLKRARKISQVMNSAYPSHSYPITFREAKRQGLPVHRMDERIEELLRQLNGHYSMKSQLITTDYDELNNHSKEICNIMEKTDRQIYYLDNKDWHYRKDERRWVTMNDQSGWHALERISGTWQNRKFYIR